MDESKTHRHQSGGGKMEGKDSLHPAKPAAAVDGGAELIDGIIQLFLINI